MEVLFSKLKIKSHNKSKVLKDYYGIKWQYKRSDSYLETLEEYEINTARPGIYISFFPEQVSDNYLVNEKDQTLYGTEPTTYKGLKKLSDNIMSLLIDKDGTGIWVSSEQRIRQLQRHMEYTAYCLDRIYLTNQGRQLIDLLNGSNHPIFIVPSSPSQGNNVQVLGMEAGESLCKITLMLLQPLPQLDTNELIQMINQKFQGNNLETKLAELAQNINSMPLYSQFIEESQFPEVFLGQHLKYNGSPIDGKVLYDWLQKLDGGQFCDFLQNDTVTVDGVRLVRYFRLAMIIELYNVSQRGKGAPSKVGFKTFLNNTDKDDLDLSRPPEVGLAHELIHALHNANGSQPGQEYGNFSTLLAELICVGLGPFVNEPITENTIRQGWDAFYGKVLVGRRKVYELAKDNQEILQFRQSSSTY